LPETVKLVKAKRRGNTMFIVYAHEFAAGFLKKKPAANLCISRFGAAKAAKKHVDESFFIHIPLLFCKNLDAYCK